jgi:hypothetical protein
LAAAVLCLAVYPMGEGLDTLASDLQSWATWLRRTWCAPSPALPLWFALTLAFTVEESTLTTG